MTKNKDFPLIKISIVLGIVLLSAGCSSSSNFSADDAVSGLTTALNVATAAVGVASGSSGGGYRPSSSSNNYRAPIGNGYSQKGAFDDCAKLYDGVDAQKAATCRQRSSNMRSLN